MDRQRMRQKAMDIIREEKSKGEVISTGYVLDNAVSVLDSVMVDREYMKRCIEAVVANSSGKGWLHVMNVILRLFGLHAIPTDMNFQFKNDDSRSRLDSMLMLNEGTYKKVISDMVLSLVDYEKEVERKDKDKVERINELIIMLEDQKKKTEQMKATADAQFESVVDWIQNVLAAVGKGESDNTLSRLLQKLMDEWDIEAYWSAEGTEMQETSMFSELRVEDISKFKEKPCLVRKGEVVAKGVKFRVVEKTADEASSEV